MTLILSGTSGLSDVDGSAATPAIRGTDANTGIFFPAADTIGFAEGGAEIARFDSSGNFGIGTSSPLRKLDVYGDAQFKDVSGIATTIYSEITTGVGAVGTDNNYPFAFATNGIERARITSGGDLLVGTTDSAGNSGSGFKFMNDFEGSGNDRTAIVFASSSNSQVPFTLFSTGAGAYRFYVGAGGTVYATSTSITAISDATLKTNVRDLETGLTQVMALRPRRFDWINGDASDVAGFIAQEVEQVLPELVDDYRYSVDEEGNDVVKKSLKMGDILPTLVKAIQEQQAIITQLQADVAVLKGTP